MVSEEFVRNVFAPWETNDPTPFFDSLSDNVSWKISGTINPFAGHYTTKAQVLEVFGQLTAKFAGPPSGRIINMIVSGDSAVVETEFNAPTPDGGRFEEEICWICRFEGNICTEVKIYVDTAAEVKLFGQN